MLGLARARRRLISKASWVAALEGFRFAREQPRVVLWWAAVYLVVTALLNILLVTFAGDVMSTRLAESSTM